MHDTLLTDLYQLTMLQGYHSAGLDDEAVFELFARRLPEGRNFLLAAGLEQLLDYLEGLRFTDEDLEWLAGSGYFTTAFVDSLAPFRFRGDVYAMAEGTPFFANEPVVRIHARISEAQLVESRALNLIHLQTLIASKAARCVLAAPDRLLVDFGMRRAHGAEAALLAARAAYIAGFSGTATVQAGARFRIPLYGTMAHSYIEAHDSEEAAFLSFAATQPANTVLLIDTYDTALGAELAGKLAPRIKAMGATIKAVRIDSGDLGAEARRVRRILDGAGLESTAIFVSSDLDELRIKALIDASAPIDGFGIGTQLTTSGDAPSIDFVYKLQRYAGQPRFKRSPGKTTYPGAKQVWRFTADGVACRDLVTLVDHARIDGATPLLKPVMRHGQRVAPSPSLEEIREHANRELAQMPEGIRDIAWQADYRVEIAPELLAPVALSG